MTKSAFLLLFVFISTWTTGQSYYFKIQLADKDTLAFDNTAPTAFLSQKSIDRKTKFQISIDIQDFPITPAYFDSIAAYLQIKTHSKWFNQVLVATQDSLEINSIQHLPFVESVNFIGKSQFNVNKISSTYETSINYGGSKQAIEQVNGNYLHENSFNGNEVLIAVFDAGFVNVNLMQDFAHLFSSNRVLATKNYIFSNNTVYTMDNHGTMVLSVLAAKKEGEIFGSAVDASYLLLLTEDVREEHLIEEYYWTNAAEFSDSSGVDIINSSLGYNTFDDSNFNHSIEELGKNSAPISQAAKVASEKGILVVSSAGNEGESSWKFITFPADEERVLAVGGTTAANDKVGFSSFGYAETNSIKPNVSALAEGVNVTSSNTAYTNANGTSFSSPTIAGLAACLWQALPNKSSQEIKTLIEESAHQFNNPDLLLGYGIPNFKQILQTYHTINPAKNNVIVSPNPALKSQQLRLSIEQDFFKTISVFNNLGQIVFIKNCLENYRSQTIPLNNLKAGNYLLVIVSNTNTFTEKLLILEN